MEWCHWKLESCFIEPMSKHVEWAFDLPHNKAQFAPKQHGILSDLTSVDSPAPERETTPGMDDPSGHKIQCPLLALTTDPERLFDPVEGHVFGSDSERCDVVLDDTNTRGVSSRHVRLFVDLYEDEGGDCLTIQNLSANSVRAISHEMKINVLLTREKATVLSGGKWTIILNAKVDIVFKLIFPDRGSFSSDYCTNWTAFRMTNERALPKLRIDLGRSA